MMVGLPPPRDRLRAMLKMASAAREEPVRLSGGQLTHRYLDVKNVLSRGERLLIAADAMKEWLWEVAPSWKMIGGPTMGADALSCAVTMRVADTRWFTVRDKAKGDHGLGKLIEGCGLGPGSRVALIDDVASTGDNLLRAYRAVCDTGASVVVVAPIVDRSGRVEPTFERLGVKYAPMFTYKDLGMPPL